MLRNVKSGLGTPPAHLLIRSPISPRPQQRPRRHSHWAASQSEGEAIHPSHKIPRRITNVKDTPPTAGPPPP